MFGVSMAGTMLIVGFSYASPHLLPGYGLDEAIGTTFIIIGAQLKQVAGVPEWVSGAVAGEE